MLALGVREIERVVQEEALRERAEEGVAVPVPVMPRGEADTETEGDAAGCVGLVEPVGDAAPDAVCAATVGDTEALTEGEAEARAVLEPLREMGGLGLALLETAGVRESRGVGETDFDTGGVREEEGDLEPLPLALPLPVTLCRAVVSAVAVGVGCAATVTVSVECSVLGEGDGEGLRRGVGEGQALAFALTEALGLGRGVMLAVLVGVGCRVRVAEAQGQGEGVRVGEALPVEMEDGEEEAVAVLQTVRVFTEVTVTVARDSPVVETEGVCVVPAPPLGVGCSALAEAAGETVALGDELAEAHSDTLALGVAEGQWVVEEVALGLPLPVLVGGCVLLCRVLAVGVMVSVPWGLESVPVGLAVGVASALLQALTVGVKRREGDAVKLELRVKGEEGVGMALAVGKSESVLLGLCTLVGE